jgi:hypothetical protein
VAWRAGFGAVTVSPGGVPGQRDDIDQLLTGQPGAAPPGTPEPLAARASPPPRFPRPPPEQDVAPKQIYETAYGYLLHATMAPPKPPSIDFLQRFPNDPLAAMPNMAGRVAVRSAAIPLSGRRFLEGLPKLWPQRQGAGKPAEARMSLQRLGQKDAACSSSTSWPANIQAPHPAQLRTQCPGRSDKRPAAEDPPPAPTGVRPPPPAWRRCHASATAGQAPRKLQSVLHGRGPVTRGCVPPLLTSFVFGSPLRVPLGRCPSGSPADRPHARMRL